MVGIIAAMEVEAKLICEHMEDAVDEKFGGINFTKGTIYGKEAVIAVCGIGKVFSAMCAEAMLIVYKPSLIINTGVAGTLTDKLTIGDIAVSDRVCQYDMDTTAIGDEPGLISGINRVYFDADAEAAERIEKIARNAGVHTHRAVIASGDRFVSDAEIKKKISDTFGGEVCEMEGGSIGHVCYVNEVPFVVVRAISDDADSGACDDYPAFAAKAADTSAGIILEYFKNM